MIKEYTKKQPSVKAMQFHGLRDIADVAELINIDLTKAKVVIQNQPDGYSIQFNESAPVYLRVGAWIVKTGDDLEVLGDVQFRAKYEEAKHYGPSSINEALKALPLVRPSTAKWSSTGWPSPLDQRDYLAGK